MGQFLKTKLLLFHSKYPKNKKEKGKAIPVTGRGGLYGCEKLRIPYCIGNWLTDGG
jgi:hypothetical protein